MDALEFRALINVKKIGHFKHIYLIEELYVIEELNTKNSFNGIE